MYYKLDTKKYFVTFLMVKNFISIVKQTQHQETAPINFKTTGILGSSLLIGSRGITEKRVCCWLDIKNRKEILEYVYSGLQRCKILVQGGWIKGETEMEKKEKKGDLRKYVMKTEMIRQVY